MANIAPQMNQLSIDLLHPLPKIKRNTHIARLCSRQKHKFCNVFVTLFLTERKNNTMSGTSETIFKFLLGLAALVLLHAAYSVAEWRSLTRKLSETKVYRSHLKNTVFTKSNTNIYTYTYTYNVQCSRILGGLWRALTYYWSVYSILIEDWIAYTA